MPRSPGGPEGQFAVGRGGALGRTRKRYERQGIVIESRAPGSRAGVPSLTSETRGCAAANRTASAARSMMSNCRPGVGGEITRLFPRCPPKRRRGRRPPYGAARQRPAVGRSSAGRALDTEALTLAVIASIRHGDTGYDDLLMSGVPVEKPATASAPPSTAMLLAAWALEASSHSGAAIRRGAKASTSLRAYPQGFDEADDLPSDGRVSRRLVARAGHRRWPPM